MSTNGKFVRRENTGTVFCRRSGMGDKGPLGSGSVKLGTAYATEATVGEKEVTVWPKDVTRAWFQKAEKAFGPCPGHFNLVFEPVAYRDRGDEITHKAAINRLGSRPTRDDTEEAQLQAAKVYLGRTDKVWLDANLEQPVTAA